jgi:hypothetical protein
MWRRSDIRQFGGVTRRAGSPEVQALGGQAGIELSRSGQPRGRTTRRAVAKANGLTVERSFRMKLIQAGYRSAKSFLLLLDGQCRCGRNGDMHALGSRRLLKTAILESRAAKARKVWRPDRTILECQEPAYNQLCWEVAEGLQTGG